MLCYVINVKLPCYPHLRMLCYVRRTMDRHPDKVNVTIAELLREAQPYLLRHASLRWKARPCLRVLGLDCPLYCTCRGRTMDRYPDKMNVTIAELLREAQPYLRLLLIFRDPVDRYYSAFHYYG